MFYSVFNHNVTGNRFFSTCCYFIFLCFSTLVSCKKNDVKVGQLVTVDVNLVDVNYNVTPIKSSVQNFNESEIRYYEVDEEVVAAIHYVNSSVSNFHSANSASSVRSPFLPGITYRLLAFDHDTGQLAANLVYEVGSSNNPTLQLLSGKKYDFIACSFNLPQNIYSLIPGAPADVQGMLLRMYPTFDFLNTSSPILLESSITQLTVENVEDNSDVSTTDLNTFNFPFYFYRKDAFGPLDHSTTNYLGIVMKQIHCEIAVNVNLSLTDYTGVTFTTEFTSPYIYNGVLNEFSVEDGSFVPNLNVESKIDFFSNKFIFHMNGVESNGILKLDLELKKNQIITNRSVTVSGLPMENGLKYTFNAKIMPRDEVPVGVRIITLTEQKGFENERDIVW